MDYKLKNLKAEAEVKESIGFILADYLAGLLSQDSLIMNIKTLKGNLDFEIADKDLDLILRNPLESDGRLVALYFRGEFTKTFKYINEYITKSDFPDKEENIAGKEVNIVSKYWFKLIQDYFDENFPKLSSNATDKYIESILKKLSDDYFAKKFRKEFLNDLFRYLTIVIKKNFMDFEQPLNGLFLDFEELNYYIGHNNDWDDIYPFWSIKQYWDGIYHFQVD